MAHASDEDLSIKKQQLRILELERKANFESTQNELRRQRDQLKALRRENKELRAARQAARKGSTASSAQYMEKEKELLKTKIYSLRRQIDDLRAINDQRVAELQKRDEDLEVLHQESEPLLTDNSPLTSKIRALENRLDKSLIKYNEAMAIRRTYEQILKRLRDERVGFDNQLAAIEKTLKAKEHDYLELLNMAHDAHHAKEIAKAEVQQFKQAYSDERKQKRKELEERKAYVTAKMDAAIKAEKALKQRKAQDEKEVTKQEEEERRKRDLIQNTADLRTEEEQERLNQYAEAYRRIKDVTKASTVDEVIAKFVAQEDTHTTLVDMTRDIQSRIDALHKERKDLRRKLDESKYSGSGQLGSRRIVDEFEAHLSEAKVQLEKSSREFERTAKLYTAVKAGISHLVEKLSTYRPEMQAPNVSDDNLVDQLKHCEQKLQMLVDEAVTNNEAQDELPLEMPQNNVRVKISELVDDDEEEAAVRKEGKGDDDPGEDDPHDRQVLKQMSISAVERENKKARKRGRKKDETE